MPPLVFVGIVELVGVRVVGVGVVPLGLGEGASSAMCAGRISKLYMDWNRTDRGS